MEQKHASFSDVLSGHWAYTAINHLASLNYIYGYENNRFGLGDNVTRGQVAAILYRIKPFEGIRTEKGYYNPYQDLSEKHMFFKEIISLTHVGVLRGDDGKKFRPDEPITRAEMAQVIKNMFNIPVVKEHTFKDIPNNYWAKEAISALQSNYITRGLGDGKFEPNKNVTREEYAQFVFNTLRYESKIKDMKLKELQKKREELNKQLIESEKQVSRDELKKLDELKNEKVNQIKALMKQRDEIKEQIKKEEDEGNRERDSLKKQLTDINKQEAQHQELEKLLQQLEQRQEVLSKEVSQLTTSREHGIKELEEMLKESKRLDGEIVQYTTLNSEVHKKEQQYLELEKELKKLSQKREEILSGLSLLKKHELETKEQLEVFLKERESVLAMRAETKRQKLEELKQKEKDIFKRFNRVDEGLTTFNKDLKELFDKQEHLFKKQEQLLIEKNSDQALKEEQEKMLRELSERKEQLIGNYTELRNKIEVTTINRERNYNELMELSEKRKELLSNLEKANGFKVEIQGIEDKLGKVDGNLNELYLRYDNIKQQISKGIGEVKEIRLQSEEKDSTLIKKKLTKVTQAITDLSSKLKNTKIDQ
ncbi:TPA: S-layer homology domain-containing protein [Bacillus tropicus]|nr:S-layer homology domain-containing protein [Bacillus tropicus]